MVEVPSVSGDASFPFLYREYRPALSTPSSSADHCERTATLTNILRMSCYAEFYALSSVSY